MSYASQPDIVTAYGEDVLFGAAATDGTIDPARVDDALRAASSEIDSYVGTRHALPLPSIPARLRDVCIDIAVYRLNQKADGLTEVMKDRAAEARRWLRDVSSGAADLGLPKAGASTPDPVVVRGRGRELTRDTLRRY